MKHFLIFLSALIISSEGICFAQSSVSKTDSARHYKNILSFYPANIFFGDVRFSYEHLFCRHIGIVMIPATEFTQLYDAAVRQYKFFHLEKQGRYYFSCKAPKGFYAGEFIGFSHATFNKDYAFTWSDVGGDTTQFTGHYTVNSFQAGALCGYRFIIRKRFSTDIYAGLGYNLPVNEHYFFEDDIFPYQVKQSWPHYGLNVGYMF